MRAELLQALEASDVAQVDELLMREMANGTIAWEIHQSLFPVVQGVLNPPFINPHLPKMYRIYRELRPYLEEDEIVPLVRLEVIEYARRPKLGKLPKKQPVTSPVSFRDIESAIREQDWEKTTVLMAVFHEQRGGVELARRLLFLGSGYLDSSLGHSISCTAFILLEMLDRTDQDPWPALATLADYFCKGGFHTAPALRKTPALSSNEVFDQYLLRATSGRGIVNLHHTITIYAIEQVRSWFNKEEYNHMIGAWIAFMEEKKSKVVALGNAKRAQPGDYGHFYEAFSKLDVESIVAWIREAILSPQGGTQTGRFLIKGLCDKYSGDYNPHYLTGLGSALWVAGRCVKEAPIVVNAFYQYVDFLFESLKSGD